MNEKLILEVKNLNVELEDKQIINDLSFNLREGEILTILGPNGSGKTILLKALLGLLPYQGKILWKKKIKIGYLPQGLSQLKVKDLPLSVAEFFKLKERISKEKYLNYLKLFGLEKDILKIKIGNLSFGQFQRILIAWVLFSEPKILFLDEPSTGIDITGEKTIYSVLHRFWQEKKLTIVLVTHDLNVVYKYSTNVLCLSKRGVCCLGKPKEILTTKTLETMYGREIKFYEHKH